MSRVLIMGKAVNVSLRANAIDKVLINIKNIVI